MRLTAPCSFSLTANTARTWLAALVSLDLFLTVLGIKCLQCTSVVDRECESGNMAAKECAEYDQYCIKYTAESENFVFRSCSKVERKNCERVEMFGMLMQVCFYTCNTDGCNSAMTATSLPPSHFLFMMTLLCVCVYSFLTK